MAAQQYDDGPEVAPQSGPEAIPLQPGQALPHVHSFSAGQPSATAGSYSTSPTIMPGKQERSYTAALGPQQYHQQYPRYYNALSSQDAVNDKRSGRTPVVFWLSTAVAVLAVVVICLAASTGIEAKRASKAEMSLLSLSNATGATECTETPVTFASLDNNCSNVPDTVTGTLYTSFQALGQQTFTIHCNKDTRGNPLMSMFVADFDACMDACSGYTKFVTSTFNESNANTTCGGVSFVPLWTSKSNASAGNAPGNCYLKPNPQNGTNLPTSNIGTECHAAVLTSN